MLVVLPRQLQTLLSYLQFFQTICTCKMPVVTLEAFYKDPLSAPLVFLAPWVFRDTIIIRV